MKQDSGRNEFGVVVGARAPPRVYPLPKHLDRPPEYGPELEPTPKPKPGPTPPQGRPKRKRRARNAKSTANYSELAVKSQQLTHDAGYASSRTTQQWLDHPNALDTLLRVVGGTSLTTIGNERSYDAALVEELRARGVDID